MSAETVFSIIIPAHNEEKYIGSCLEAIKAASEKVSPCPVQTIVVANRCTDRTAEIAQQYGAEVCLNEEKCISSIRNSGARLATGKILVTIDADSCMTPGSLLEIKETLESGEYIGGGTQARFNRMSLGIMVSSIYIASKLIPIMKKHKAALTGGMFWCYREDFEKIGGFDETLVSLEDMDFAIRLKQLGDSRGKKYGTLKKSRIITSSRKFDEFGDWYLIKNRNLTNAIFTGKDREAADKFYYDVR
ncbi:MAG: glycosyltransferase [Oscillospiraceae bacterium]